ncbi:MAG: NAD(P)/FAD-dependent oxidoreductase [Methyloligellaceae bacterium]
MSQGRMEIVVVGAGIVGASIAWHLTRRGAKVTIIADGALGGVATPNSLSWINSNPRFPRDYFDLRTRSMSEWRRLASELPGLPVKLAGSVYLPDRDLDLEAFVAQHTAWGYRVRLIDGAELKRIEPHLTLTADVAAHAEDEGAAESEDAARFLVEVAGDGDTAFLNARVEGLASSDGRVIGVRTADGIVLGDEVVVAAGVGTPEIVAGLGIDLPLDAPAGLLAHTAPVPPLLNGVVLAEGLHMRQKLDGALIGGASYEGALLLDDAEAGGRELLRRMAVSLDAGDTLTLDRITVGYRPTPPKGFPIIGRPPGTDGLYIAVMHSGVTLAPAIGLLSAQELLDGDRDPLLAPFGPEQYLMGVDA